MQDPRSVMNGRSRFQKYRKLILTISNLFGLLPIWLRRLLLFPFFNLDNFIGAAARYIYYKSICREWGDNIYIASKVTIKNIDRIIVGDNVSIHEFCYIDGFGGVEIGSDVSIAHASSIISFEHDWAGDLPIKYNPSLLRSVKIGDDVWIGCGVRILAGAHIGSRTVVAAGAVVKGTHPGAEILGGIPARSVKKITR